MKRRKALLSEEELLVGKERDKVRKTSKRASETREQTLHFAQTFKKITSRIRALMEHATRLLLKSNLLIFAAIYTGAS